MNTLKLEDEIYEINKCILNLNRNINSIDQQISKNTKENISEIEETNSNDSQNYIINKHSMKKHFYTKKCQTFSNEQNNNYISEQSSFSKATNITRSVKRNSSISPDSLREVSEIINKTNQDLLDKNIIGDEKEEFKINPYFRHSFYSTKSIPRKNNSVCLYQSFNNIFFQDNILFNENGKKENEKIENDKIDDEKIENEIITDERSEDEKSENEKKENEKKENLKKAKEIITLKKNTIPKKKIECIIEKISHEKLLSPYINPNQKKKEKINKIIRLKNDKLNIGKKLNFSPSKTIQNTVSINYFKSDFNNTMKNKTNNLKGKIFKNEKFSFEINKTIPPKKVKTNFIKNNIIKENKTILKIPNKPIIQKIKNDTLKNNNEIINVKKKKNIPLILQEFKNVPQDNLDNVFMILKEINKLLKDENKNKDKISLFSELFKYDKNFKEIIISAYKMNDLYKKCCKNKKFLDIKNSILKG